MKISRSLKDYVLTGTLALGTALVGCGDNKPKYADHFSIEGKVIEINNSGWRRDFLISSEYRQWGTEDDYPRDSYSEKRLYHVGTTNPEITWKRVKKGDGVYIEGQHGGECEEISYFKDTFGDRDHFYLQQKHSDDVIDMIHVGLLRIE
jgi:hypothetical protein